MSEIVIGDVNLMQAEHKHHECAHEQLKYCAQCQVAYCEQCHREWGELAVKIIWGHEGKLKSVPQGPIPSHDDHKHQGIENYEPPLTTAAQESFIVQ